MRYVQLGMLLGLLLAPRVSAAALRSEVLELQLTVFDLVFTVQDVGGQAEPLTVKESTTEIRMALAADVLFDFDKAAIRPQAHEALRQAATVIKEQAKSAVRIEGHTDAKGADAYNQKLSAMRATAVKDWLVQREGVKGVPFVTRGFGAQHPAVPNTKPDGSDDPEGRQKNRRVEIIVMK